VHAVAVLRDRIVAVPIEIEDNADDVGPVLREADVTDAATRDAIVGAADGGQPGTTQIENDPVR
jgi:hypothetical protein